MRIPNFSELSENDKWKALRQRFGDKYKDVNGIIDDAILDKDNPESVLFDLCYLERCGTFEEAENLKRREN